MTYDPDADERFKWRYERACEDFKNGGSEDVFRASLFAIGYRGARLQDEVRYQLCLRYSMQEAKAEFNNGLLARI